MLIFAGFPECDEVFNEFLSWFDAFHEFLKPSSVFTFWKNVRENIYQGIHTISWEILQRREYSVKSKCFCLDNDALTNVSTEIIEFLKEHVLKHSNVAEKMQIGCRSSFKLRFMD